jgi:hypothetical protein
MPSNDLTWENFDKADETSTTWENFDKAKVTSWENVPVQGVKEPEFHPIGNVEYGGAETGSLLFRGIDRNTGHSSLEDAAKSLDDFRKDHPEYAPEEVQNTLDLLSNPRALTSRVLGGAAYTGLMIGTSAVPVVGPMLTGLTAYGIESQRAFESAKEFGATDQEAETAAIHIGTANAIGQMFMNSKMLHVLKGEEGALGQAMSKSASSWVRALGPAADLGKDAGVLGSLGAIQGAIDDKIALDTYGKPNDKNYWDKRLQEFATGAAATVMFGAAPRIVKKIIGSKTGDPIGETEINVVDRDSAYQFFKDQGAPQDSAKAMAAIADSAASQWAMDTGRPKEQWFTERVNERNFQQVTSNGQAIQNNAQSVFDAFDTDPAVAFKTLMKQIVEATPADKARALKDSLGIDATTDPIEADRKVDGAVMRYLWDGASVAPELADHLEDIKQQFRDTYKNVSALEAQKISPETKVIFDSMLAPETDEIKATRGNIDRLQKTIETSFPEFKPVLSKDFMESLTEPIREVQNRLEDDPTSDFPKQITETVIRQRTKEEMAKMIEDHIASITPPDIGDKRVSVEGLERTKAEVETLLQDQMSELDRLRMGRLIPSELSGVEKRASSGGWLRDAITQETPSEQRQNFGVMSRIRDKMAAVSSALSDQQSPLRRWKWGQLLLDMGSEVDVASKKLQGQYSKGVKEAFTSLSWRERQWLQKTDADGFTNFEKIVDQTIVQDIKDGKGQVIEKNPRAIEIPEKFSNVKDLRDFLWKVNKDMARTATQQGVLMRFSDGKHLPFRQPEMQRFLRLHTDDFRTMMRNPSSKATLDFFQKVKELNPELSKLSIEQIQKLADKVFNDTEIRSNSSLEAARLFKIVPSEIQSGGKRIKIFETDPLTYAQRAVKVQADRLSWGKITGQQQIETVGMKNLKRIAEALGVSPREDQASLVRRIRDRVLSSKSEDLQARIEKNATKTNKYGPQNSVESAMNSILGKLQDVAREKQKQSEPETATEFTNPRDNLADRQALADAIKIARDLGISLKPTRQDYLDNLSTITATNMDAKQKARLPGLARSLEGIDPEQPPHILLSEIKSRLNEDAFNHIDTIKENLVKESGGVAKAHFEDVLRQMQGIPQQSFLAEKRLPSVIRSLQTIAGSMLTSLRAPLHVAQPLWQIGGKLGLQHLHHYLGAMGDLWKDFANKEEALKIIGAVPEVVNSWGFEKVLSTEFLGRLLHGDVSIVKGLESLAGNVRQAANKFGGVNLILHFNDVVAGQTGRRFAEALKNRPIIGGKIRMTAGDVSSLKSVGVSMPEIEQIRGGQMSDTTYSKIVQGTVNLLGTNLPSWKKAGLENSPIARLIVPFAGYAINNGRLVAGFFRDRVAPALKSKNPIEIIGVAHDLALFVSAAAGAGALTNVLYNIPRGNEMRDKLDHEDDSKLHAGFGALMKIGFMGPAARFMESLDYNGGDKVLYGMMPYLKQTQALMGLLINEARKHWTGKSENTRFAEFGMGENIQEFIKSATPAIKAFGHFLDNATYPDKPAYDEARTAGQVYKEKQSKTVGTPPSEALDPDKERVLFYVVRNDPKGAITAAQEYYKNYVEEVKKNPRQAFIDGKSIPAAMSSLRESLLSRAPLDLKENEKLDFLSKLPKDRMQKYFKTDLRFRSIVDGIAPSEK